MQHFYSNNLQYSKPVYFKIIIIIKQKPHLCKILQVQVLFPDILSAGHLDIINWEFFVRTVKHFFGFLASHNRFFLSSYQSVCTTFLPSVSMEGISLFVVNFFSKQLFADFFFLFPFLQRVHILNLKIFRIMA